MTRPIIGQAEAYALRGRVARLEALLVRSLEYVSHAVATDCDDETYDLEREIVDEVGER